MYLRHQNHAEIQPVPGVPQKGEGPDAETPSQDLYQRLERVNASERVPVHQQERERRDEQTFRQSGIRELSQTHRSRAHTEMRSTFTVQKQMVVFL